LVADPFQATCRHGLCGIEVGEDHPALAVDSVGMDEVANLGGLQAK
jgi:hypothetical protein